jgi:hypothetical protein
MLFDPIIEIVVVMAVVIAWQQWNLRAIHRDLDEVIDSHNAFVTTMIEMLDEAAEYKENEDE